MSCILAVDVGTGSVKAGFFDTASGKWLALARSSIATRRDGPRAEQNADEYWQAVLETVAQLQVQCPQVMSNVGAVSVTGQMRGLVLVDGSGGALGPVLTLYDRRAGREAAEFLEAFGPDAIHRITGQRLDASGAPARLRWLGRQEPDSLSRARWLLPPKDYIRFRLTGSAATDPIDAAGLLLYDLSNHCWHDELARFAMVRLDQLPPILPTCSRAGVLRPRVASLWGLREDTAVVVGGGDDIAAIGAGAIRPGDVYEHIGSTGSIFAVVEAPVHDPAHVIECYPSCSPDLYWAGGSCNGAGTAIDFALDRFGRAGDRSDLVQQALSLWHAGAPAERPLYLPFVAGERCPVWDPEIMGAWLGLSIEHTAEQLVLAAHEGVALLLGWILDELKRLGVPAQRIFSAGRGAENADYGRLRATIYGQPIHRLAQPDAALSGAVLVAATAIGWIESPQAGLESWARPEWSAVPEQRLAPDYRARLDRFRRCTRGLSQLGNP